MSIIQLSNDKKRSPTSGEAEWLRVKNLLTDPSTAEPDEVPQELPEGVPAAVPLKVAAIAMRMGQDFLRRQCDRKQINCIQPNGGRNKKRYIMTRDLLKFEALGFEIDWLYIIDKTDLRLDDAA